MMINSRVVNRCRRSQAKVHSMEVKTTSGCTFFFFFQAEDGIRDLTVTGVQTCALPIFTRDQGSWVQRTTLRFLLLTLCASVVCSAHPRTDQYLTSTTSNSPLVSRIIQIGRASCRERV